MGKTPQNNRNVQVFNEIASTYDRLNHLFSFNLDRYWRNRARRAATFPPDAAVLDLCSGTADVAVTLAKHQRDSRIYGLDASANMLSKARTKLFEKGLSTRIRLIHADALHLPFAAESFDLIFLSFGLRNLPDRQQGTQEIVRVLKPGGQLIILEFTPPKKSITGRVYRRYLQHVIPFIGELISRSPTAYRYLFTSIEEFLSPAEVIQLLHENTFQNIACLPLTFGIVQVFVAQ